jgi:hypothetical protein
MKVWINKLFILSVLSLSLFACKKDEDIIRVQPGTTPTLGSSASDVVLSEENAESEALTLTWTASDFGFPAAVAYSLQFDSAGSNFATPDSVDLANALTRTYTVKELNDLAIKLGLEPAVAGTIEARIRASVSPNVEPVYSNVVALTVTPYSTEVVVPVLYVPGGYQGWNPATADVIADLNMDNSYEGYIFFPANELQFKITPEPDWDSDWGDETDGTSGKLKVQGANLLVPAEGYYLLKADINALTWSATKTTWGVIGSATAGGWDADQDMTYDATAKVWKVTLDLTADEIKFRANDDWPINFGDDGADGSLEYSANSNIKVPEAGRYEIILDLSDPRNYTYSLNKL